MLYIPSIRLGHRVALFSSSKSGTALALALALAFIPLALALGSTEEIQQK